MDLSLRDPAHRVSPRAPLVWGAGAALTGLLGAGALTLLSTVWGLIDLPWWAWLLYAGLALAYLVIMPTLRFRTHRWETTDTAVYTQTGWIGRERRIAPMSRVQTVDFEQGVVARLLGLASVTVTTASAAGALSISGLDRDVAERLVRELTQRADLETGDAT